MRTSRFAISGIIICMKINERTDHEQFHAEMFMSVRSFYQRGSIAINKLYVRCMVVLVYLYLSLSQYFRLYMTDRYDRQAERLIPSACLSYSDIESTRTTTRSCRDPGMRMSFLPCNAMRYTVSVIVILSVCPSVCLSVTLVDCVHMVRPTIMISSPYGSPIILVSGDITFIPKFEGGHPERGR